MRKMVWLGLLAVAGLLSVVPVVAHDEDMGDDDDNGKWKFHGEIRGRLEYLENYLDLQDSQNSGDINDDEESFIPYRVSMSMDGKLMDNVRAMVELNYTSVYGTEDPVKDFTFPPYQGLGTFYDRGGFFGFNSGVRVHQAIMEVDKIGGSNFDLRVGRMEHAFGTQLFLGDNDFYGGTSFDGARLMWNSDQLKWDLFYYVISEQNFGFFLGEGGANDINMFGGTVTWNLEPKWGQVQGYYINLQHLGFSPYVITNFNLPADSKIHTLGGRWGRMVESSDDVKNGHFDYNVEFAFQTGDEGDPYPFTSCVDPGKCDRSGTIGEAWLGYNFEHGDDSWSRVHIGGFRSSGDKNDTDDKIEDFTTLFMNTAVYNRLGDADFVDAFGASDIEDWNAGYEFHGGRHMLGAYFHKFKETEVFIDGDDDDLGNEFDLKYAFQWKPNVSVTVGYDVFNPGDAYDNDEFSADKVLRAWAQLRTRW